MKNRTLLLIALLSFALWAIACGGATNSNNAASNSVKNANTNTTTNVANTMSNSNAASTSNTMSNTSNMAANKPANAASNTAANKAASNANSTAKTEKPPKGSTFECNDGTYSDAKNSQGACSGHGGIKKPVKP